MRNARDSQHGHMSVLLIMPGFQLEFIIHSFFCCQHSNCAGGGWRGLEIQSLNRFLTLVNKRKAAAAG